jgi:hypothetical protein
MDGGFAIKAYLEGLSLDKVQREFERAKQTHFAISSTGFKIQTPVPDLKPKNSGG